MLTTKNKLKRSGFKELKNGKSFHSPNITLRVYRSFDKKTKFSFVVSKKISKKSTERNKVKRFGYNSIREIFNNIKNGFSCVFFFKKGSENLSYKKTKEEVSVLLKKARIV